MTFEQDVDAAAANGTLGPAIEKWAAETDMVLTEREPKHRIRYAALLAYFADRLHMPEGAARERWHTATICAQL